MGQFNNRILLFIKVPPPTTGATSVNLQVLKSELIRDRFNIHSILISYANSINDLGKFRINKLFVFFRTFKKLLYECISHRPQFIYFQLSPFGAAFYRDLIYITLIKVFHIRIVFHLHGKGIKQLCKYKIRQLFYKYAFRNSDIICLSDLLKSDLEDVYKGTIHIVNNGIPDELIIDSETQKSHEKLQILFLSNLLKSKGIIDFIESLKILSGKDITFYANILGAEGDIEPVFLNDKIRELNLSNEINYLGTKTGEEKNKIIEGSDVLIYPSLNDAFPLVLLEVMRYAKPIIATREGAIPEIVDDGRTGFLVEKHNPGQISEKLEVFVRNPGLIKIMGDAGRKKFLQNYTMDIFESNLKNVFEEVLTNLHQRND